MSTVYKNRSTGGNSEDLKRLIEKLKISGLRVTQPRIAIIRALSKGHGPFTVEHLHKSIPKKVCDLATIYRTLEKIEQTGIIRRCEFGDGTARYELAGPESHHHHVICKRCKQIEVLSDCELDQMNESARRRGFTEITHSLEFFGICPNCKGSREYEPK